MTPWEAIRRAGESSLPAFIAALDDAPRTQDRVLSRILTENSQTDFGRRYGFASVRDADEFRSRVPITAYDGLAEQITRIAAGERDVLFAGAPVAFEETGGTAAGSKLVPYPPAAIESFRAAVLPWLADLIAARPKIGAGRAYWAVSPVARAPRVTRSGVPIGMSDASYLGDRLAVPFAALSVVPPTLAGEQDLARWRFITLCHLAAASDLTLVSVWSPSFFSRLLVGLREEGERVARTVAQGRCASEFALPPDAVRAGVIREALRADAIDTAALWPALDTVSCWAHGSAAASASELAGLLPHARMQAKGVLATEGAISIPLSGFAYPVLAIASAYFEFIDQGGHSHRCHELRTGDDYRVVMTTPGGLYRYDIGDRVRCRGFAGRAPQLEFVGRASMVCDLVGEKLVEDFVAARLPTDAGFILLVPRTCPSGYALIVDARRHDQASAAALAESIDHALRDNPQYAYARKLGQLAPLIPVRMIDPAGAYARWALARGQRLGDIKPVALQREADWVMEETLA